MPRDFFPIGFGRVSRSLETIVTLHNSINGAGMLRRKEKRFNYSALFFAPVSSTSAASIPT
jgi:hypothetical protein